VVKLIESGGRKAKAFQMDSSKPVSALDGFAVQVSDYLKQTYGVAKFDYLINNAGIGGHGSLEATTEDSFDNLFNVQFKSVFFLTQKLLPFINDHGGIINISSALTRIIFPNTDVYASAKGAIEVLSKVWAVELASKKIRVNVVAPGAVATDFNGGVTRDNPELNKTVSSITALGRPGMPQDLGGVIAFLCTDDAFWINGQRIEVSGGMRI
jgi:NAD(P)-dependent dehydrogenase (short-subunit alcohol dehydrogenase family)